MILFCNSRRRKGNPVSSSRSLSGLVYDVAGNIVSPPPGPERDRLLKEMGAWDDYWSTGDDKQLVELEIFPESAATTKTPKRPRDGAAGAADPDQ